MENVLNDFLIGLTLEQLSQTSIGEKLQQATDALQSVQSHYFAFAEKHPNCDESTVVGAVAKNYAGKKVGDSVFDPVFVLAAVLEWAGIVHNRRGELVLTQQYLSNA